MAILSNYLLFNHTYLKALTSDTTIDPDIPFTPRDLGDWYDAHNTSSPQALVDSWVQPMLSLLELEIHLLDSDDQKAYKLTTAYDHDTAIGICYVAPPGADLNTTTKGQFWMAQAVLAARRHEPTLRWVILTNGDLWRLLDAQALRRYEAYVQVDVGQLARGVPDPSAMRVFFRCFHRTAFDKHEDNKTGIEKLLEASDHATEKAERHLKERVSGTDGIMAQLCLGLVRSTGKSSFAEEERDAIYRDATTLLYRMLFMLYAESRELLPTSNPEYAKICMKNLVKRARYGQQNGIEYLQANGLWEQLKRLSNAIYESDPNLDIPAYNGGLFDDNDHPYLRDGFIADQYLSRAIYDLTYLPDGEESPKIDYRDLDVRHLGSLYEGMIDYKLFVAEEPMLARRDKKGNILFQTQQESGSLRRNDEEIKVGDIYFAHNSGERRSTGTYYTPECIVDYIVKNTVLNRLEEYRADVEGKLSKWLDDILVADPDNLLSLQRAFDEVLLKFVNNQVLNFTVCDPAMGSGHFLINSTHNITNFIIETFLFTIWVNSDIDSNPGQWRRRVAERCLYGVDISEMAVELTKLSLWLATMAEDEPLSFLKHHLRQGNSLIGARLKDFENVKVEAIDITLSNKEKHALANGQPSILDYPLFKSHINIAFELMAKISSYIGGSIVDIKNQETDYERMRIEIAPFQKIANLLITRCFIAINEISLKEIIMYLVGNSETISSTNLEILSVSENYAYKYNYFHWFLEFPEIFFPGLSKVNYECGFNVVIGNPPYNNTKDMNPFERKYCYMIIDGEPIFYTANAKSNLYAFFWEKSINLTSNKGLLSLVTPYSWLSIRSFQKLREIFLNNLLIKEIILLPLGIFDAGIETSILIGSKPHEESPLNVQDLSQSKLISLPNELKSGVHKRQISIDSFNSSNDFIFNLNWRPNFEAIINKMVKNSVNLEELCLIDLGINTANDSKYVGKYYDIKQNPKKILSGSDFGRYWYEWNGSYVYYLPSEMTKDKPTARPGEPQRFEKEKIILYRFLDKQKRFVSIYDNNKFYCLGSTYVISANNSTQIDLRYLNAILNSNLIAFFNSQLFSGTKITKPQLLRIPIKKNLYNQEYFEDSKIIAVLQNCDCKKDQEHTLKYLLDLISQSQNKNGAIYNLLISLSNLMIEFNTQRLNQIRLFIDWMEEKLETQLDSLIRGSRFLKMLKNDQNKGDYYDWDELLLFLIDNKGNIIPDPNHTGFQNVVSKKYEQMLNELLPLEQKLAFIDKAIDKVVCILYGLSEEEIAIVEGEIL